MQYYLHFLDPVILAPVGIDADVVAVDAEDTRRGHDPCIVVDDRERRS